MAHWLSPDALTQRRREFRSALALQGFTMRDFLAEAGVTATHMNLVLRGERPSPRLDRAVYQIVLTSFGHIVAEPYSPPESPDAQRPERPDAA